MSIARARRFRKQMSPAEARLWNLLRAEQLKAWHFRRQVPLGPHYADFASHRGRLIVEVDGSGHFNDQAEAHDAQRDAFMEAAGYRVLRVTTADVLNRIEGVQAAVVAALPGGAGR